MRAGGLGKLRVPRPTRRFLPIVANVGPVSPDVQIFFLIKQKL